MARSNCLVNGPRIFDFVNSCLTVQFGKIILGALRAVRLNFDEFNSGGLHEKYPRATLNLGTISAFA
jgi:hypothetical protein